MTKFFAAQKLTTVCLGGWRGNDGSFNGDSGGGGVSVVATLQRRLHRHLGRRPSQVQVSWSMMLKPMMMMLLLALRVTQRQSQGEREREREREREHRRHHCHPLTGQISYSDHAISVSVVINRLFSQSVSEGQTLAVVADTAAPNFLSSLLACCCRCGK